MGILVVQLLILAVLAVLVVGWIWHFPHPSPFVRPLLHPILRWPEQQIRTWLGTGRLDHGYLRFFNRDPERTPPAEPGLLAPADGLITSAEVCDGIRYLVIALSFWDMHVQRIPAAGKIVSVAQHGDQFMDGEGREFAFLREKNCPVQTRVEIDTRHYGRLAVRLITSLAAKRIEVWPRQGEVVERGQRLGRILLGSTVVLELPAGLPLRIEPGERVRAGETLMATAA